MNSATTNRSVLIVEDDQVIANIYRSRFEKAGYAVEVAPDGQAGFYRIHEAHPSAVLLDLMLPQMNGVDILKKIRAQKRFATLPIIVFTNAYLTGPGQEAAKAGATMVFNKATSTPQQVVDAVEQSLSLNPGALAEPMRPAAAAASAQAQASPAAAKSQPDADAAFLHELTASVTQQAPETAATLNDLAGAVAAAGDDTTRLERLQELYRKVHSTTGNTGLAGLTTVSRFSAALEALLKELHEKPDQFSDSPQRTLVTATELLGILLQEGSKVEAASAGQNSILVLDHDAISRRAIVYALERVHLKPIAVDDPIVAKALLANNRFDLIIVDSDAAQQFATDFIGTLRQNPAHSQTPIVTVVAPADFAARSAPAPGQIEDMIAKPFLFIELAVKSLVQILRMRLK
jgi:DNA-binding response OmpR family regulator